MQNKDPGTVRVIVSHDVDHLFSKDHWFRDLFFPKLWIRTTLELLRGQATFKEWLLRNTSCFRRSINNIDALMEHDKKFGIPSTFFFGMAQGLGMSYRPPEARSTVRRVYERGAAVGVHGIEYRDFGGMKREYDTFMKVTGLAPCGIRMHYVRFDKTTFEKLNRVGYHFDTTEFDKNKGCTIKSPYRVGQMWEFPLTIMDSYLPAQFPEAKKRTLEILDKCREKGLRYITVLFHDPYFCGAYRDMQCWYMWLTEHLSRSEGYKFVSFEEALRELEEEEAAKQNKQL